MVVVVVGTVIAVVAARGGIVVVVSVTRGADIEIVRVLEPRGQNLIVLLQQTENHRGDLTVALSCRHKVRKKVRMMMMMMMMIMKMVMREKRFRNCGARRYKKSDFNETKRAKKHQLCKE